MRFSHHTEAVAAARTGQGIALGWHVLVERFLQDGSLVRIGIGTAMAEGRYNLVVPLKAQLSGMRDLAAIWMTRALHS